MNVSMNFESNCLPMNQAIFHMALPSEWVVLERAVGNDNVKGNIYYERENDFGSIESLKWLRFSGVIYNPIDDVVAFLEIDGTQVKLEYINLNWQDFIYKNIILWHGYWLERNAGSNQETNYKQDAMVSAAIKAAVATACC